MRLLVVLGPGLAEERGSGVGDGTTWLKRRLRLLLRVLLEAGRAGGERASSLRWTPSARRSRSSPATVGDEDAALDLSLDPSASPSSVSESQAVSLGVGAAGQRRCSSPTLASAIVSLSPSSDGLAPDDGCSGSSSDTEGRWEIRAAAKVASRCLLDSS